MEIFNYPRTVHLDSPKLLKLEREKGKMIEEGRAISQQIEDVELEMGKIDIRIQKQEADVDVSDLKAKGDELLKEMEIVAKGFADQIKAIEQQIYDRMKEKVDPQLKIDYDVLSKKKEDLENARNKKALAAQRTKDRIIPLARKLMAPYLENEYEDFMGLEVQGDVIVAQIFSHLDDFDRKFKEKKQKELNK